MARMNHRFTLAARPVGLPKPTDFAFEDEPIRELQDGELLVKVQYISLDPAMRGWMNDVKSYIRPIAIGEVFRAGAVGEVVESKAPGRFMASLCTTAGRRQALNYPSGLVPKTRHS